MKIVKKSIFHEKHFEGYFVDNHRQKSRSDSFDNPSLGISLPGA